MGASITFGLPYSLRLPGYLTVVGQASFLANTAAISSTVGAVVVTGGIALGGDIFSAGNATFQGGVIMGGSGGLALETPTGSAATVYVTPDTGGAFLVTINRASTAGRIVNSSTTGFGNLELANAAGLTGEIGVGGSGVSGFRASVMYLNTQFAGAMAFGINGAEKMRIASSGNVGIGTTNPLGLFFVHTATDLNIRFSTQSGSSDIASVNDAANAFAAFKIEGSVLSLNAQSGGNVGIGTTAPSSKLVVKATSDTSQLSLWQYNWDGGYDFKAPSDGSLGIYRSTIATPRFLIDPTGNVGIGTASPGVKLDVAGAINATGTTAATAISTLTQNSGTGYGLKIVPGSDSLFALGITNAANNAFNIQLYGDGHATFGGSLAVTGGITATSDIIWDSLIGVGGGASALSAGWVSGNANQLTLWGSLYYNGAYRAAQTGHYSGRFEYTNTTGNWVVYGTSTTQTAASAITNEVTIATFSPTGLAVTGAFSATGSSSGGAITFGPAFTALSWGTNSIDVNGVSGGVIATYFNGTATGYLFGSSSDNLDIVARSASGHIRSQINGGTYMDLTTAGLAVTGALIAGISTFTTVNGLTISITTGTLSITNGKTLTVSNSLTLSATDGSTLAIGGGGTLGSAAYTASSAYEVPLTFSTGLNRSTNTVTVNTSQSISVLSNLTTNGFVKTSGNNGTLTIDTNTYLTGNQTITLSGDVSGSGATSITTAIGASKVTNTMLAGSIAASKLIGTDITMVGTISSGTWNGTVIDPTYGGTGVNNGSFTLTLTTSGTLGSAAYTASSAYAPATSGTAIFYGNGSGGFSNVTISTGLSFVGGTLTASGSGGTVTSVSVVIANGISGTVSTATTTPAITLTLGAINPSSIGVTSAGRAVFAASFDPTANAVGAVVLQGSYGGGLVFSDTAFAGLWTSDNGQSLHFGSNGSSSGFGSVNGSVTLKNGLFGIGNVPTYTLDVSGTIRNTGGLILSVVVKTASYSLLVTDYEVVANSGNALTFTLPSPVNGQTYVIKNRNAGVLTLSGGTMFAMSAVTSFALRLGESCTLCYDGTYWIITS